MDESLNWTKHVKTVESKMARYIGLMYKLKKLLPLGARLQIYHSFVQSHVNFCALVWGFSSRSNIELLFSKQKKGIRAVMPGYVNYTYRKGKIPGHTKLAFTQYGILTVQNLIANNAFLFIYKIRNFPSLVPLSIRLTISKDSPTSESTHESCKDWLQKFNTNIYNKSVFFKGPLLYATTMINEKISLKNNLTLKAYKKNLKKTLLFEQKNGDPIEWQNDNLVLYNGPGLRQSRIQRETVNYSIFFE